eukprot:3180785-Rhodomonas_salina.1
MEGEGGRAGERGRMREGGEGEGTGEAGEKEGGREARESEIATEDAQRHRDRDRDRDRDRETETETFGLRAFCWALCSFRESAGERFTGWCHHAARQYYGQYYHHTTLQYQLYHRSVLARLCSYATDQCHGDYAARRRDLEAALAGEGEGERAEESEREGAREAKFVVHFFQGVTDVCKVRRRRILEERG